jgi:hypothetical protein
VLVYATYAEKDKPPDRFPVESPEMKIYFSDYFDVDVQVLQDYGALNISLVNDLPLFVDPFLLFNSDQEQFQGLHEEMIRYLRFLREMSSAGEAINPGLLKSWFLFPEVKQNWLGYSKVGNRGSGLGREFANVLNNNLYTVFRDFGSEGVTQGSHLEKLCLIKNGVGRDSISDFTTNLIKKFLCEYTERFAAEHINSNRTKCVAVKHICFNYALRVWESKVYRLPFIDGDYVLLTPKEILTKDDTWINKHDLINGLEDIVESLPNDTLRSNVNEYFLRMLPEEPTKKDRDNVSAMVISQFPELIDYYIKYKEEHGEDAEQLSEEQVKEVENLFIDHVERFVSKLADSSDFYDKTYDTFEESFQRVMYLKQVIENNDGYRIFYVKGNPIKRESDLQLIFRLTWFASPSDVNSEVNNGRGPVDYKISRGDKDKTLIEFKLASNSKLKKNLEGQLPVYEQANQTKKSIKVILFFSDEELKKVQGVMELLKLKEGKTLILIDARRTNKISASNVSQSTEE